MAYFPNGTAGEIFRGKWCDRCLHDTDYDNPCMVWGVHLFHNYKAEGVAREILDSLIVDNKIVMDDGSSPCRMFIAAAIERAQKEKPK